MPRLELLGAIALLQLAAACPSVPAANSGNRNPVKGVPGPCDRSFAADAATARERLGRDRADDAVLYVDAVIVCPGALDSLPLLLAGFDVYEEVGRLNDAWRFGLRARELLPPGDANRIRLAEQLDAFDDQYVLLLAGQGELSDLGYAGPVPFAATARQVEEARTGQPVSLAGGRAGFWLFPGTYRLAGSAVRLDAGSSWPEGSR